MVGRRSEVLERVVSLGTGVGPEWGVGGPRSRRDRDTGVGTTGK